MPIADGYDSEKGKRFPAKKKATPFLDEFGEDLTKAAQAGKLDPIIGRDREIYRICQILARRKKNNPIILGDPGVGKTAIVEAIAQRIVSKKVARVLLNKRVISLKPLFAKSFISSKILLGSRLRSRPLVKGTTQKVHILSQPRVIET